jgi:TrpR family trp operon transcriptional repressor
MAHRAGRTPRIIRLSQVPSYASACSGMWLRFLFYSMKAGKMNVTDRLVRIFCSIDDPRIMKRFMKEIFTASEFDDISKRWKVLEMLERGHSQRDIASKLGMSLCKITRGSKVLKTGGSVSKRILDERIARR